MAQQPTLINSVVRALNILDAVAEAGSPQPAKRLARTTGVPLPTTYHLLRTLVHEGYLLRTPDGYVLGDRVDMLGRGAASRRELRVLRGLHDQLGAPAYLADLDGEEIRLTEIVDSPTAPRVDLWVGMRDAAHATALGKAILGTLPVTARRDYLADHALLDLTPHTITSLRALLAELERSREVAVDRQEYAVGTVCTAVPVPGQTKAVAVSLPADRAAELPAHAAALRRAATLLALAHR